MGEENINKKEKNIEIKKTFSNLIKEEMPEMTQEEAIMQYQEDDTIKIKKTGGNEDESTEESEHLKRIKKELLASLERVKQLARKLYGDDGKGKFDVKAKSNKQNGKQRKMGSQENEAEMQKENEGRERE